MNHNRQKLVLIGGGTGSFALLSSLKNYDYDITALVNMSDDGGSTGLLRDEYGVLPPGDVRQCLVALSEAPQGLRELFNFRFPKGSQMEGHSFGNLFLSSVEMMSDDFNKAVGMAGEILRIKGRVLPITLDKCELVLKCGDQKYHGQRNVSAASIDRQDALPELSLKPKAKINPAAKKAIAEADIIVIAPGDLYSSLLPALIVEGVPPALKKARAPIIYVCNLVNKPHQTENFSVNDYVGELERFIGRSAIDYVLYNTDEPSEKVLKVYTNEGERPVRVSSGDFTNASYLAVGGSFLSHKAKKQDENDTLILRSLIRHDGAAVGEAITRLLG